ncbi:hypothetical protein DXG01_010737 [Tephrocybe rancida]|nr:hypothetical protein DXG01_010737 [Tephrocybe rancida]
MSTHSMLPVWPAPFGPIELFPRPHEELLEFTAEVSPASHPGVKPSEAADIFDNSLIASYPLAYIPGDLSSDAEGFVLDPSVWRVLQEEHLTFVRPEDLTRPLGVQRQQQSVERSPSPAPFYYRPTLDEFMSNMEQHRDCFANALARRTNGESARSKTQRKWETSKARGPVLCPFPDCSHVCNNRNDLERHLLSREHKEPSVPCPKYCGAMFTRNDSAKRHGRSCVLASRRS